MITSERHKEIIDTLQKDVDESGKALSHKLLKSLKIKALLQEPKLSREKFIQTLIQESAEMFQRVGKYGVDFGKEKLGKV